MEIFQDKVFLTVLIVFAVILCVGIAVALARFVNDFTQELKYLNIEISRSQGEERRHWIRRRRRLWLSIIPFVKY